MANRSTSPDGSQLRWLTPAAYLGAGAAVAGMGWLLWWTASLGRWPMVLVLGFLFGLIGIYLARILRILRSSGRARERARARGGLAHIVSVRRAGDHYGWLTLHHEIGDIGFFSWSNPAHDLYVPRHAVATVGRESDGSTRITWLGDSITSMVVASPDNNLELWSMPAAEAHAHARTGIPTATARIRDDK